MSDTSINTDKELYREPTKTDEEGGNNAGMEPHVFVTEDGGIGMNYYGKVIVKPIKEWVNSSWKEVGYKPPEEQMNTMNTPQTEQKTNKDWKKEFQERFVRIADTGEEQEYYVQDSAQDIEHFISDKIVLSFQRGREEERQRIREKVEGMKEPEPVMFELAKLRNETLDQIIESLEEQKEEA